MRRKIFVDLFDDIEIVEKQVSECLPKGIGVKVIVEKETGVLNTTFSQSFTMTCIKDWEILFCHFFIDRVKRILAGNDDNIISVSVELPQGLPCDQNVVRIGNVNLINPDEFFMQPLRVGDFIPCIDNSENSFFTKTGLLIEKEIPLLEEGGYTYSSRKPGIIVNRTNFPYFGKAGEVSVWDAFRKVNSLYVCITFESAKRLVDFFSYPFDNTRTDKYTAWGVPQDRSQRDNSFILKIDKTYDSEKQPFLIIEPYSGSAFEHRRGMGFFNGDILTTNKKTTFILTNSRNEPTNVYEVLCEKTSGKRVTYSTANEKMFFHGEVIKHFSWTNRSGTGAHWAEFHVVVCAPDVFSGVAGYKRTTNSRSGNTNLYQWVRNTNNIEEELGDTMFLSSSEE